MNDGTKPAQTGPGFIDSFPADLTVTGVGPLTGTGCSGTPAFTPSTVSLANGAIGAGNPGCSCSATVRGDNPASYLNDNARLDGQAGGIDPSAARATLSVFGPPSFPGRL